MAGRYKAYPAYKDSGVEWLGEIPEGWTALSLRQVLTFIKNGSTCNQLEQADNTIPVSRIETISSGFIDMSRVGYVNKHSISKEYKLDYGDILLSHINSLNMVGNIAIVKNELIYHGMNLLRLKVNNSNCFNYYYWFLRSKYSRNSIESIAKPAINQASVSIDLLKSFVVLRPSLSEQQTIAQFLDYETAKIDALIAKQEQLIALLKEKRQAVISHAVTKGLNPDAPMKDSGVEWLGQVPEHWEIWKLSHAYSTIGSGTTPPTVDQDLYDGDIPWVTTGELRENIIFDTSKKVSEATILNYPTLRKYPVGSVLIAMYGATIGRLGILGVEATTNQACCVLPFSKVIINKYTFYWLLAFKEEIIGLSSGGGQPNINQEKISNLRVSAPDIVEQKTIVEYLETIESKMEELIKKSLSSIQLLQERKTALISAAVTGKIDVRDWQPPSVG